MRKGIILAGGTGSRLWPITIGVSKQLLPVFDKPMIYYPLSVLMLCGIREIAVISAPGDTDNFKRLLGSGEQWGIKFTYLAQPSPEGLAQAYTIARDFLEGCASTMVLGDNLFFGHGLTEALQSASRNEVGGTIMCYRVRDARSYGVADFDVNGKVRSLVEKPETPPSKFAVTGLYFLDGRAPEFASTLKPSRRGELEIVDLLKVYLNEQALDAVKLGRGFAWLDTGTPSSLLDAGNFVRTLADRQGQLVGSPDEVAFRQKFISSSDLIQRAKLFEKSGYGEYLYNALDEA